MMEEENRIKKRIPVLGHIPLLGWFFTSYDKAKSQTELLLVVSPRITRALSAGSPMPELNTPIEDH